MSKTLEAIQHIVSKRPSVFFASGLRSCTAKQVEEIKTWLKGNRTPFEHRTKLRDGTELPYNGVLYVNIKRKYGHTREYTKSI